MPLAFPCVNVPPDCECLPFPVRNFSVESPDVPVFFGQFSQPPTTGTFFAPACLGFCESTESQQAADDCAEAAAVNCSLGGAPTAGNPLWSSSRHRFGNTLQECTKECGDGNSITVDVPAGSVISYTQADADARAMGRACKRAGELLVCFVTTSPIAQGNVDAFVSVPIVATGGNGDYLFTLESGSLPPGISLDEVGLLLGTPTLAGTYTFELRVDDTGGGTATRTFTWVIASETAPVAWWKFDGFAANPVDEVGSYVLAFAFNIPGFPGGAGKIGESFAFVADGVVDSSGHSCVYQTSHLPPLAYTGAGVEFLFWMRFNGITTPNIPICSFNFAAGFEVGSDFYAISMKYDTANPNVLSLTLSLNNTPIASVSVAHVPAIGVWRFIRVRYDNVTSKLGLSVDNAALSESGAAVMPAGTSTQLSFSSFASPFDLMSVSIDEFGMFLQSLTDAEASAVYNGGAGETCCPLAP